MGMNRDFTERKQVEEALKRRVAELSALNTMAAIVNESLDVDEILNRAMDEALRQVGVESAAMLLLNGNFAYNIKYSLLNDLSHF